jgi:hypothetical protein
MTAPTLLDAAGRRRSPATMPGFHRGRPPRNKGRRYPADLHRCVVALIATSIIPRPRRRAGAPAAGQERAAQGAVAREAVTAEV